MYFDLDSDGSNSRDDDLTSQSQKKPNKKATKELSKRRESDEEEEDGDLKDLSEPHEDAYSNYPSGMSI